MRPSGLLYGDHVPGILKDFCGLFALLLADQDIVRVVGGEGEQADTGLYQGLRERQEHAGQRKIERPLDLEAGPGAV